MLGRWFFDVAGLGRHSQYAVLLENEWKLYHCLTHVLGVKLGIENSSETVNGCAFMKSQVIVIEDLNILICIQTLIKSCILSLESVTGKTEELEELLNEKAPQNYINLHKN